MSKPTEQDQRCPSCGTQMKATVGTLTLSVNEEEIEVEGIAHQACPNCYEQLMDLAASKALSEGAKARYRARYGILPAAELRGLREGLKLSQQDLARLLLAKPQDVMLWELGRKLPYPLQNTVLQLLGNVPGNLDYLRRRSAA